MAAPEDRGKPAPILPARILIVENDVLVASCIEEFLTDAGFAAAGIAASAAAAMSLAAQTRPTLALVDIRLAGPIDGIDLACQLRQQFNLPTIFISGQVDLATAERARAVLPLGFLTKPFLPSQMYKALERALAILQDR